MRNTDQVPRSATGDARRPRQGPPAAAGRALVPGAPEVLRSDRSGDACPCRGRIASPTAGGAGGRRGARGGGG